MTNSYGINETIDDPSDISGLEVDFRTLKGSARCCQFYTELIPPAWYFFKKESKVYTNERFGVNKQPYGSWGSGLIKLNLDSSLFNSIAVEDLPNGTEVINNVADSMAVMYEKSSTALNVVGTDRPSWGDAPMAGINGPGTELTPYFIGQIHIDTFGAVWMAVNIQNKKWHSVSMGAAGS